MLMKNLLLAVVLLTVVACSQQKESTNIESVLAGMAKPAQIFLVSGTEADTITTVSGIQIAIPANAFVSKDGSTITGESRIEITEVTKKSEMIFNRISTTSDGKLIESSGMFHIKVINNGNELDISPNAALSATFPNMLPGSGLFYGVKTSGVVEWQLDTSVTITTERLTFMANGDTIKKVWSRSGFEAALEIEPGFEAPPSGENSSDIAYNYPLWFTRLGWINCDRFVNMTEARSLTITTGKDRNPDYHIVLKELNSVLIDSFESPGRVVTDPIPPKLNATLVLIELKSNELFFAKQEFETGTIDSIHLLPQKISKEELQLEIEKLDVVN
jgi:hypothetical protein